MRVSRGENQSPHGIYAYADGAEPNGAAKYVRLESVTYPDGRVVEYSYGDSQAGATSAAES